MASEPSIDISDVSELLLGQLAYYRATLLDKLSGLSDEELRRSRLPSGWTPLQLLKHLGYVERRWMRWGFAAEPVPDPWGDNNPAAPGWALAPDDTLESLTSFLAEQATRVEALARTADLTDRGRLGGRFETVAPTLGWILVHLVQEYARHLGHLDVVRELIDGQTGE